MVIKRPTAISDKGFAKFSRRFEPVSKIISAAASGESSADGIR